MIRVTMGKAILWGGLMVTVFLPFNRTEAQPGCMVVGGPGDDESRAIVHTADGGYVLAGRTNSFGAGGHDVYVVKLDSLGYLQWTRTVGGTGNDEAWSITRTSDGGYAVFGNTSSYGAAGAYLVRLNATGNVQWTRTVDFDSGWSVLQSRDGGFLLVGTAYGWYDFGLVAKLDGSGNLQWGRFTNSGLDAFIKKSAIQTPDGGFLVAGVVMYQNIDLPDLSLIKLSSTGQMQWSRGFYYRYASGYEETNALISTRDSGYMIVGWTDSYGVVGGKDVLVVKLDSLGHLQWARTVGGTLDDVGEAVVQTDDGGYAVAGWTQSFGAGSTDVYIFKLDSLGNLQWTRTAGGTGNDVGYDIVQTRTGDLVVVGYTTSYGAGNRDMFLVKLDASGNVCAGCGGSPGGEVRSPNIIEYPIGAVDTLIPSLSGGFTTDSGGVAGRICGALDVEEHPGGDFAENISVSCVFRRTIQIRVAKALPDPMHVVLRDMAGRVVYDRTFPSTRTRVLQDENLRRLRPGVYGLTLVSGGRKSHRRLVKLEE